MEQMIRSKIEGFQLKDLKNVSIIGAPIIIAASVFIYRRKLFARYMNSMTPALNKKLHESKLKLFENLKEEEKAKERATILEVGVGTCANLCYYDRAFGENGCDLIVVDPNKEMEPYLRENAKPFPNINVKPLIIGFAENLSMIDDESLPFIVSTLVLCSTYDTPKALKEFKRILKPNGKLLFLEHVKSEDNGWCHLIQCLLGIPFYFLLDGCRLRCKTGKLIEEAGFSRVSFDKIPAFELSPEFPFPGIYGVAVK